MKLKLKQLTMNKTISAIFLFLTLLFTKAANAQDFEIIRDYETEALLNRIITDSGILNKTTIINNTNVLNPAEYNPIRGLNVYIINDLESYALSKNNNIFISIGTIINEKNSDILISMIYHELLNIENNTRKNESSHIKSFFNQSTFFHTANYKIAINKPEAMNKRNNEKEYHYSQQEEMLKQTFSELKRNNQDCVDFLVFIASDNKQNNKYLKIHNITQNEINYIRQNEKTYLDYRTNYRNNNYDDDFRKIKGKWVGYYGILGVDLKSLDLNYYNIYKSIRNKEYNTALNLAKQKITNSDRDFIYKELIAYIMFKMNKKNDAINAISSFPQNYFNSLINTNYNEIISRQFMFYVMQSKDLDLVKNVLYWGQSYVRNSSDIILLSIVSDMYKRIKNIAMQKVILARIYQTLYVKKESCKTFLEIEKAIEKNDPLQNIDFTMIKEIENWCR
jgi:hypothetical protein